MLSRKEEKRILSFLVKGIFPFYRENKETSFFISKDDVCSNYYVMREPQEKESGRRSCVTISIDSKKMIVYVYTGALKIGICGFSLVKPNTSEEIRKHLQDVKKQLQEHFGVQ